MKAESLACHIKINKQYNTQKSDAILAAGAASASRQKTYYDFDFSNSTSDGMSFREYFEQQDRLKEYYKKEEKFETYRDKKVARWE